MNLIPKSLSEGVAAAVSLFAIAFWLAQFFSR